MSVRACLWARLLGIVLSLHGRSWTPVILVKRLEDDEMDKFVMKKMVNDVYVAPGDVVYTVEKPEWMSAYVVYSVVIYTVSFDIDGGVIYESDRGHEFVNEDFDKHKAFTIHKEAQALADRLNKKTKAFEKETQEIAEAQEEASEVE